MSVNLYIQIQQLYSPNEARHKYSPQQITTRQPKKLHNISQIFQKMVNIVQRLIHYILTLILLICSIAYIIPAFGV